MIFVVSKIEHDDGILNFFGIIQCVKDIDAMGDLCRIENPIWIRHYFEKYADEEANERVCKYEILK